MSCCPDTDFLEILDGLLGAYVAIEIMSGQSQCDSEHCAAALKVINDQFRAYMSLARATDLIVHAARSHDLILGLS